METNRLLTLAKQALLTFTVSLILFAPISGLVLEGFSFRNELTRAVLLAALVAAGRVALSLVGMTAIGRKIAGKAASNGSGVTVMTGTEKSPALILGLIFLAGLALPFFADKYFLGIAILALI
jgi:branched-chain amino acid transport system permease protein